MLKAIFLFFSLCVYAFATDDFYYNGDKKIPLEKITQETNNNLREVSNATYYKTQNNMTLGVTDEIILKLKDKNMLAYLSSRYNFIVIEELFPNMYLIKAPNKDETLPMANQLHLEESVSYASPNFLKTINKR